MSHRLLDGRVGIGTVHLHDLELFDAVVRANIGEATLSVRDLLELNKGDVITINTRLNDDIEIYVEKEMKFFGRAGLLGKHKAIEILARVITKMEGT